MIKDVLFLNVLTLNFYELLDAEEELEELRAQTYNKKRREEINEILEDIRTEITIQCQGDLNYENTP